MRCRLGSPSPRSARRHRGGAPLLRARLHQRAHQVVRLDALLLLSPAFLATGNTRFKAKAGHSRALYFLADWRGAPSASSTAGAGPIDSASTGSAGTLFGLLSGCRSKDEERRQEKGLSVKRRTPVVGPEPDRTPDTYFFEEARLRPEISARRLRGQRPSRHRQGRLCREARRCAR